MRITFKAFISICLNTLLLIAFQNCGKSLLGAESRKLEDNGRVDALGKSAASIAKFSFTEKGISWTELHADGRVTDRESGNEIAVSNELKSRIQALFTQTQLCAYVAGPLPAGTVTCMMMPLVYAEARTAAGENIELTETVCSGDTIDMCRPEARAELRAILADLANHAAP